jgi:hypothetical protein
MNKRVAVLTVDPSSTQTGGGENICKILKKLRQSLF